MAPPSPTTSWFTEVVYVDTRRRCMHCSKWNVVEADRHTDRGHTIRVHHVWYCADHATEAGVPA
jgi:hypothetical protein